MIVKNFTASHPDFYLEDLTEFLPEGLLKPEAKKGYIQFYPNVDHIDGFFISRLRRKAKNE
jgi:16S rRNA (cytosine967-C5)-methyltransferase